MQKNIKFSGLLGITFLTVIFGSTWRANALTFTTYTDRASWEAATGSFSSEDFNSSTQRVFSTPINESGFNGFDLSGSFDDDTVQIAAGTASTNINGTQFLRWNGSNVGPTINFDFNTPVNSFAFDWNDTDPTDSYRLDISDGSSFEAPPFSDSGTGTGFFGIVASDGTFTSASFISTAQGGVVEPFGIDNVAFSSETVAVPFEVSPTLGLFIVGGIFGVNHWRKRRLVNNNFNQ